MGVTFNFTVTSPSGMSSYNLTNRGFLSFNPGGADRKTIVTPINGFGVTAAIIGKGPGIEQQLRFHDYVDPSGGWNTAVDTSHTNEKKFRSYNGLAGTLVVTAHTANEFNGSVVIESVEVEREDPLLIYVTFNLRTLVAIG